VSAGVSRCAGCHKPATCGGALFVTVGLASHPCTWAPGRSAPHLTQACGCPALQHLSSPGTPGSVTWSAWQISSTGCVIHLTSNQSFLSSKGALVPRPYVCDIISIFEAALRSDVGACGVDARSPLAGCAAIMFGACYHKVSGGPPTTPLPRGDVCACSGAGLPGAASASQPAGHHGQAQRVGQWHA
jgi:hypothetical protein